MLHIHDELNTTFLTATRPGRVTDEDSDSPLSLQDPVEAFSFPGFAVGGGGSKTYRKKSLNNRTSSHGLNKILVEIVVHKNKKRRIQSIPVALLNRKSHYSIIKKPTDNVRHNVCIPLYPNVCLLSMSISPMRKCRYCMRMYVCLFVCMSIVYCLRVSTLASQIPCMCAYLANKADSDSEVYFMFVLHVAMTKK